MPIILLLFPLFLLLGWTLNWKALPRGKWNYLWLPYWADRRCGEGKWVKWATLVIYFPFILLIGALLGIVALSLLPLALVVTIVYIVGTVCPKTRHKIPYYNNFFS
jgi:hypothetical protein